MRAGILDRFMPRSAPDLPLVFSGPAQVRAYWEALRRGSALPDRAALDPRGLSGVLDRVFLAERIGTGLVQVRLAGSALAELAGTDLKGLPLSCLFTPESRPLLAEVLERVFTTPSVAEIDLGSDRERQGRAVARLLLLPMQGEAGLVQVLGAFGLADGMRPCKLQVLARRLERVGPPEPAFVPVPPKTQSGQRGHLRLVASEA